MHYFAYGSNMNLEHMRRLCGWHFQVVGAAELKHYEFGVDLRGYFNIRPKDESSVWGVLFEIDDKALAALDEWEGYPEVFGRGEVSISGPAQKEYRSWVYVEAADQFGGDKINQDYYRRVTAGARENYLPPEWLKMLENLNKLANG
ncbi:MAG TPA: gamma-glutamylcyclotransferase family protein [Patescibacteria group bacterium]|nr:gamma-glutamylcyclotransferase family protein [Patescibacteria group bacterium]